MITQDVKRKLTAILSADVEGYRRLMGEDDVGTVRTLTAHRDAMTELIGAHRGRVVDVPGDNLLAEFASVIVNNNPSQFANSNYVITLIYSYVIK